MTRRLFAALLVFAVVVLAVHEVLDRQDVTLAARRGALIDLEREATRLALLAQDDLEHVPSPSEKRAIAHEAHRSAMRTHASAVVVDRRGTVLAVEPTRTPRLVRAIDDEVRRARRHPSGRAHTRTLGGTGYEIVAVPIAANQGTVGVVVLVKRSAAIDAAAGRRFALLTPALLVALVLAAILAWILARALSHPLDQLVRAAKRVGTGARAAPLVEVRGPQEVREVAEAFNAMSLRVRDLLDRQGRFASDVSHQLRTPLMAVELSLDHFVRDYKAGDEAGMRRTYAIARREVARLGNLVEGLLALTRVPLDAADTDTVDVAAVAGERVAAWSDLAAESEVSVELEAPDRLGAVAVTGAVDQLLDNLLDNALEVAPAGSSVEVSVVALDADVVVAVRDHGPGLSEQERSHAFERFWRGADAAEGGIGIGLTIVRDLAEASQGDVVLLPAEGGGTRAVLTLRGAVLPDGVPPSPPEPPSPGPPQRRSGARATKVAAIVFGLVVVGGGVAAANGSLPHPVQQVIGDALSPFGISIPRPPAGRHDPTTRRSVDGPGATAPALAAASHRAGTRGPGPTHAAVDSRGSAATTTTTSSPAPGAGPAPSGTGPPVPPGQAKQGTATPPPGLADTGAVPPGQGGTPPGQGGTPPGQGGTPPGQAKQGTAATPPGLADTGAVPPGQGGTPPGQAKKGTAATPPGQAKKQAG